VLGKRTSFTSPCPEKWQAQGVSVEVVVVDPDRLVDVLRLYREHSQTLGFMPSGAFEQRADRGTLLVAIAEDGTTCGYVLYDLPKRHITVRHLCVDHRISPVGRRVWPWSMS